LGASLLVLIYETRCELFEESLTPSLNLGKKNCSLIDLNALQGGEDPQPYDGLYDDEFALFREPGKNDSFIVILKRRDHSLSEERYGIRIHLAPKLRAEYVPRPGSLAKEPFGLYFPGSEYVTSSARIRSIHQFSILSWLKPSWGMVDVYSDEGSEYKADGGGLISGTLSPNKDFLLLTSQHVHSHFWNDAYLEVYRRRDHSKLVRIRVSCCGYFPGYALSSKDMGWLSNRDFFYLTGRNNSECVVCRLDP